MPRRTSRRLRPNSRRRSSRHLRANPDRRVRFRHQVNKIHTELLAARSAVMAGIQDRADFKDMAVLCTRLAKAADRAAAAEMRSAAAGGHRFVIDGPPGTGNRERAAAARYREEAADARKRAEFYRTHTSYPSRLRPNRLAVAETILRQMGGAGTLTVMIGAHTFVGSENSLTFKWKARAKGGANTLQVTLDPSDTYTMEFFRYRSGEAKPLQSFEGVYAEDLRRIFESTTGLYIRL